MNLYRGRLPPAPATLFQAQEVPGAIVQVKGAPGRVPPWILLFHQWDEQLQPWPVIPMITKLQETHEDHDDHNLTPLEFIMGFLEFIFNFLVEDPEIIDKEHYEDAMIIK